MTTELEQEFFNVFGIEPKQLKICRNINHCPNKYKICNDKCESWRIIREDYFEITDCKLLQLLCIYNDMQGQVELCLVPCEYEDTKEMILQTLVDEKTKITDYEEGTYMDVMTRRIQQLFKEEE